MKFRIPILITIVLVLCFALSLQADGSSHDVDMTIRQVAHEVGLRGRELAEKLGLEGSVDKDTALSELGVSQKQLDAVLTELPSPEPGEEKEHPIVSIEMTLQEAAHAMPWGSRGRNWPTIWSCLWTSIKRTP